MADQCAGGGAGGCGQSCGTGTPPMAEEDIPVALTKVPLWSRTSDGGGIVRVFEFCTRAEMSTFFTMVQELAEQSDHDPNFSGGYKNMRLTLTTHSAGNSLTQRDFDMAEEIDRIFLLPVLT